MAIKWGDKDVANLMKEFEKLEARVVALEGKKTPAPKTAKK